MSGGLGRKVRELGGERYGGRGLWGLLVSDWRRQGEGGEGIICPMLGQGPSPGGTTLHLHQPAQPLGACILAEAQLRGTEQGHRDPAYFSE